MHLLQINTVAERGSIGHIAENIGNVILQAGGQSTIAYGRGTPQSNSELLKIGTEKDVYMHAFISRLFDNAGLMSTIATKDFIKKIEDLKPDIIQLHNIHGYYLNYEILFSWLRKSHIPVVWTLHDCWPFTGHCPFFTYAQCDKWISGCHDCSRLKVYPKSLFWDGTQRNYTRKKKAFVGLENLTIVAVSKWMESVAQSSFLKDYPIVQIYNGVDTDIFSPQGSQSDMDMRKVLGVKSKYMLLGVCADWDKHKEKGLDDIIQLSYMISDEYTVVLVGMTKGQIKSLPDHIIGVERIESQRELAKFYSAADVVLNLSYEESMGMTTVEGLSCGTPSIVYNSTASPELIDPTTGYLFERGDLGGISANLSDICTNASSMLSSCRDRVLQNFDMNNRFQDYLTLYNSLLQ